MTFVAFCLLEKMFFCCEMPGCVLGGIRYTGLCMLFFSVDFGSLWLTRIPFQGLSSRIHILRMSPADVCSRS